MSPLFGFLEGMLSPSHILIVLVIGILFFGKRLPEIGRSLGKGIVEFKKGLKGLEDEMDTTASRTEHQSLEAPRPPQRMTTNVPKFEDAPPPVMPTPPQA